MIPAFSSRFPIHTGQHYLVSERKARVLNKMKIKTTRSENNLNKGTKADFLTSEFRM